MVASIAPSRDMQSATCALAANPNDERRAASGRRHPARTRNPTLPAIGVVPPVHSDAKIAMLTQLFKGKCSALCHWGNP
jgi:hypothetical protein